MSSVKLQLSKIRMHVAYTSFGDSMVEGLCRVLHQTCAYWGRETVSVDRGKGANESFMYW